MPETPQQHSILTSVRNSDICQEFNMLPEEKVTIWDPEENVKGHTLTISDVLVYVM
jgi:hypothetical protein